MKAETNVIDIATRRSRISGLSLDFSHAFCMVDGALVTVPVDGFDVHRHANSPVDVLIIRQRPVALRAAA